MSQAFAFSGAYAVVGFFLMLLLGFFTRSGELGDLTGYLLVALFLSVIAFWPGAVLVNLILLRLWRRRSWRRQPWRPWVAGSAVLPVIYAGLIAAEQLFPSPPKFMVELFGHQAPIILLSGQIILSANFAIVLAWTLPDRRRKIR